METERDVVRRQIGVLRLVIAAMGVGILGLTVVASPWPLELGSGAAPPTKLLTVVCVALMLTEAVAYLVLRGC